MGERLIVEQIFCINNNEGQDLGLILFIVTSEMLNLPKTHHAAVIAQVNTPLIFKAVELKLPVHGEVFIGVLVCGVCNFDGTFREGGCGDSL